MQRYFIPAEQWQEAEVKLLGEDARHASKVMRMKEKERFIVSDGLGRAAVAAITAISDNSVEATVCEMLDTNSEPKWHVTVAQALPKGDKMELIIQKGTEIGASHFIPFVSERTIVQYDHKKEAKRLERWGKIAKEAAEQAHRSVIPQLDTLHSWKQMLGVIPTYDLVLFCYEEEGRRGAEQGLRAIVSHWHAGRSKALQTANVLIMIGPEGGFTHTEAEEAKAAGAVHVSLGRRILRTETAGFTALACLMYEAGEMGGI